MCQNNYFSNYRLTHMNFLRLSPPDNLHLYDLNIPVESEYLILDKYLINAHPNNLNTVFYFMKILCLNHIPHDS